MSGSSCCSSSNPCGISEGDCDHDNECSGSLLCGTNNCFRIPIQMKTFDVYDDCCYDPFLGNTVSENPKRR